MANSTVRIIGLFVGLVLSGCAGATSSKKANAETPLMSSYNLSASIPLYATCVNLSQALVNQDPKPKVLATLKPGIRITAIEAGWTQMDYRGDTYVYIRDPQDFHVHADTGLDGCISFEDSMTDDGTVRDAGLQHYLGDMMTSADRDPQMTVGGAPASESIGDLDGKNHYSKVSEVNAGEGTDF